MYSVLRRTAYARRNLWLGIANCGENYIYCDTDSIFYLRNKAYEEFVSEYNKVCEQKLRLMCDHYGLDYEKELLPKTIKGKTKPLGIFEYEDHIDCFKSLGSKRYMTLINGELSITVSGVNKVYGVPWLLKQFGVEDAFTAFEESLVIPEDATGKLTHYYIDKLYEGTIVDYQGKPYHYVAPSGIYLEKASYSFSISEEYIRFLKGEF